MTWLTTADPQEFLDRAGDFLRARTVSNTVPLTVATGLAFRPATRAGAARLFGWWQPAGNPPAGAFIHTPPHPVYLSDPPAGAIGALAELLAARGDRPSGVDGPGACAADFAAEWTARCACRAMPGLHTRLYRLGALRPPEPPAPGRAVVAGEQHRDLLIAWLTRFADELRLAGAREPPQIDERLAAGAYTCWQDGTGEPVALAGCSRDVNGARRIGPVYTPPERRGRGYGGAVTAAACRRARETGSPVLLLYADADNAISNRLYRRLGFEVLDERRAMRFEDVG